MALFNYTVKEITLKVVYYGPGFSGKTTNLQQLHTILPSDSRGKLISLATEADRTLFFDFLPVDLGKVKDFNIRIQLYTVPGQVKYNATRRLVLKGADAVVFVADSQKGVRDQNIESFNNMKENLAANNLDPHDIPVVIQYNKRDLENIMSIEELNGVLNKHNVPFFEAVAAEGKGVQETFKDTIDILVKHISKKHKIDIEKPSEEVAQKTLKKTAPQPNVLEAEKPVTAPPINPQQSTKPMTFDETITPVGSHQPLPSKSMTAEKTIPQAPPFTDVSKLAQAVRELTVVISGIQSTLKDMQKTQNKTLKELSGFRQTFLTATKKRGWRKFF
ncbi:MAG: GTPase domain-containing protein [Thermodesulfovibrionia bacterium]|nr:GTPase domain-containing protein [Thermodesulfovibrionia bacterium]